MNNVLMLGRGRQGMAGEGRGRQGMAGEGRARQGLGDRFTCILLDLSRSPGLVSSCSRAPFSFADNSFSQNFMYSFFYVDFV